jgi:hypothetical protein
MTATADLRTEVLDRLRALAVARPERTVHLTIDVVRYGASLPIPAVLATLESLRERGEVVHAGGGWRLPDGAGSGRAVWLVLISDAVVHSIHSSERGARARAAELDNFDARVEQRRVED